MHPRPDLSRRSLQPELMDQPDLPEPSHARALRGMARINRLSGTSRSLFPRLADLARRHAGRPVRVLDLACGGGDVAIGLAERARRAELPLEVAGCDRSPVAVRLARESAARAGSRAEFFAHDCLLDGVPPGFDAITCTLFLHHVDRGAAVELLASAAGSGARAVLVSDLVRSRAGWVLAQVATRVLTRSEVVHVDGPRSVECAFTIDEAREVAREAGLDGARIRSVWPCRFLLEWERP